MWLLIGSLESTLALSDLAAWFIVILSVNKLPIAQWHNSAAEKENIRVMHFSAHISYKSALPTVSHAESLGEHIAVWCFDQNKSTS